MKPKLLVISFMVAAFSPSGVAAAGTPGEDTTASAKTTHAQNAALFQNLLKIKVGSSTHADVVALLGQPWRTTNDADCEATQYGEVWEYLAEDAKGAMRIHVAFSKDGKASLVAKIRPHGGTEVLAFIPAQAEHRH